MITNQKKPVDIVQAAEKKQSKKLIIGLTGPNCAGKGTVAEYLKKKGFIYFSLSDMIREEATRRNKEHSRENLVSIGNKLREKFGPGVLGKMTKEKIIASKDNKFIVDSIRNPAEIEDLRKLAGFYLLGIDADVMLRYERSIKRGRNENAKTFEDFVSQENKEKSADIKAQQLHKCIEMADLIIDNSGTAEELNANIEKTLKDLKKFN